VGVLPGIGPLAGITLLIPATYRLEPTGAIIMLAGIYYGAMYGGSTTSILMNIPGESASVVTCIDGYQMTLKGRGGAALFISAWGSWVGGTLAVVGLMIFAPVLANFAMKFGPAEMFAVLLVAFMLLGSLGRGSFFKTMPMVCIGILLGMVGMETLSGALRFTHGILRFYDGIGFLPVAMGALGVGEILGDQIECEHHDKGRQYAEDGRGRALCLRILPAGPHLSLLRPHHFGFQGGGPPGLPPVLYPTMSPCCPLLSESLKSPQSSSFISPIVVC